MGIIREERIGGQRLILGDCLEVMPGLGQFDAVVTDPPYGIGEGGDKNSSRANLACVGNYKSDKWDSATAPEAVNYAVLISNKALVFGGNYYDLPPSPCWFVWDKQNGMSDFADCELVWTNLKSAVRLIRWRWNGMLRKGSDVREHPTQKPSGVMKWCLDQIPKAQTILDPFMGSGTTLVACQKLGRSGTGIELDPEYFEIACRRIDEATQQPDLFVAETEAKPVQEAMI